MMTTPLQAVMGVVALGQVRRIRLRRCQLDVLASGRGLGRFWMGGMAHGINPAGIRPVRHKVSKISPIVKANQSSLIENLPSALGASLSSAAGV